MTQSALVIGLHESLNCMKTTIFFHTSLLCFYFLVLFSSSILAHSFAVTLFIPMSLLPTFSTIVVKLPQTYILSHMIRLFSILSQSDFCLSFVLLSITQERLLFTHAHINQDILTHYIRKCHRLQTPEV